ncbi:hypothetical protein BDQ17DRAFT_1536283 [Cyathus striatus]|nr:hypothetical protein BDQ17DRAFT_1536283 [Cyathus striatus]
MPSSPGSGVQFKFTHAPTGCTRRISFPANPDWQLLASNLETLYATPAAKIAVSYIDEDNDEVTLSTEGELQEFYSTSYRPGQLIKFRVLDLSSRPIHTPGISTFPSAPNRAFIVQEDVDEWQIPLFSTVPSSESGPHAFVEVLGSNASTISMEDASHQDENDADNDNSFDVDSVPEREQTPVPVDKGKGKAVTISEFPSTASVIAEDTSQKYPIHVYAVSAHEETNDDEVPVSGAFAGEGNPVVAESTPKSRIRDVDAAPRNVSSMPEATPDPPLPSIENTTSSASLSNDVATLLTNLNSIVASHPELSEGLRNIVRNVGDGTYWKSHRDSLSRSASDLTNSAGDAAREARRRAEEEAGRRVTEALGGLFRTLSTSISNVVDDGSNDNAYSTQEPRPPFPIHHFHRNNHINQDHHPFTRRSWGQNWYNAPPPPPPPFPPHTPTFSHSVGPTGPFGPPPPSNPPPPPVLPPPPVPLHHSGPPPPSGTPSPPGPPPLFSFSRPTGPPPPPGPPSFAGPPPMAPPRPPRHSPFVPPGRSPLSEMYGTTAVPRQHILSYNEHRDQNKPDLLSQSVRDDDGKLSSPQELRSKKSQENHGGPEAAAQPGPSMPYVMGNARLPISKTDIIGVRRHNTHPGHGSHHHSGERKTEEITSRAVARITKRLSDMGFTGNGHPELGSKIRARLPETHTITKDDEDNIVTLVLEELLAMAPNPSGGSVSGLRDGPGA